jgi:hypothetical protein
MGPFSILYLTCKNTTTAAEKNNLNNTNLESFVPLLDLGFVALGVLGQVFNVVLGETGSFVFQSKTTKNSNYKKQITTTKPKPNKNKTNLESFVPLLDLGLVVLGVIGQVFNVVLRETRSLVFKSKTTKRETKKKQITITKPKQNKP